MNWLVVQRVLGLLLMLFSMTMLPPIGFSIGFRDGAWLPFLEPFASGYPFGERSGKCVFGTGFWSSLRSGRYSGHLARRRFTSQETSTFRSRMRSSNRCPG